VTIAAVKPASRGEGVIVRLVAPAAPGVVRLVSHAFAVRSAALCDARERDLGELAVDGGVVTVAMTGTIATVRLVP